MIVKCPKCLGFKGITGRSDRNYPATIICPRCNGLGEVKFDTLTETERNPKKPVRYERDDA